MDIRPNCIFIALMIVGAALGQEEKIQLSGAVVDSVDKAPVVGIRVAVLDSANRVKGIATTDAAGQYEIELEPGVYNVSVRYFTGGLGLSRQSVQLVGVEFFDDRVLDVEVPPVYTILVWIVHEDGTPLAEVEIRSKLQLGNGALRPDENGHIALRFPPGEYTFAVVPAAESGLPAKEVRLEVVGDLELDIVVERGFQVRARVIDEQGKPLVNAWVGIQSEHLFGGSVIGGGITGLDGRFESVLPAEAEYRVIVRPPPGSILYGEQLTLSLGGDVELEFVLRSGAESAFYRDVTASHLPFEGLGGQSMDAGVADLDGDGDVDLMIANEFRPNILLLNDGEGRFTDVSSERIPQVDHDSEDVGIADLDGDGDLDIVVVSEDNRTNELYLNDGSGFFADGGERLPAKGASNAVLVADVDGDGDPDVLIGNGGAGGQNALLLNDGSGFFNDATERQLPASRNITQDIELGDVDGDGDLDLLLGNEGDNALWLNDGAGFFADGADARIPLRRELEETREADFGDVDADGDLDIYFANVVLFNQSGTQLHQNRLLLNDGTGFFADVTASNLPPDVDSSFDADFIDVDGDGDLDVIAGNSFPAAFYRAYLNDGSGFFVDGTAGIFPRGLSGNGFDIEAADVNGDHSLDLYLAGFGSVDRLLFGLKVSTAVYERAENEPHFFALEQNYPNPFNSRTHIKYQLASDVDVELTIYNLVGQLVKSLVGIRQAAGNYQIAWDGTDDAGIPAASGVYVYRLIAGNQQQMRRLVLVK